MFTEWHRRRQWVDAEASLARAVMKARRTSATSVWGAANAKSIAALLNCSSNLSMRITVLAISSGVHAPTSLIVHTARLNAGLKSRCEMCVTSIGFECSASPSARDPYNQYVWMNAIARQADADTKWSLATAVNIRLMASFRAHKRRVASRKEKQASACARRTLRPCEDKRTHWIISLPNGTSKIP
eukprot:4053587-Pleurochrysis_carterae.AAC.1